MQQLNNNKLLTQMFSIRKESFIVWISLLVFNISLNKKAILANRV